MAVGSPLLAHIEGAAFFSKDVTGVYLVSSSLTGRVGIDPAGSYKIFW